MTAVAVAADNCERVTYDRQVNDNDCVCFFVKLIEDKRDSDAFE